MRLIAGHLFELASFLEALDDSIETGGEGGRIPVESILAGGRVNLTEKHSILNRSKSLDTINESIEGTALTIGLMLFIFIYSSRIKIVIPNSMLIVKE